MAEPPAVPMVRDVQLRWWYCLECGEKNSLQTSIEAHWRTQHRSVGDDTQPTNGVEYCIGQQLLQMQARRDEWIDAQADKFVHDMHEGFTVADFEAEVEIRGGPIRDA